MAIYIIFVIILCTLFLPIPISARFLVNNHTYTVKLYGINIISKDAGAVRKFVSKKDKLKQDKNIHNDNGHNKKNSKKSNKSLSIKLIFNKLVKNKFKPKIKIKLSGYYSLGDASNTAILYGLINTLEYSIYRMIGLFLNPAVYKVKINPSFSDKLLYEFSGNCIIITNLSQIIIMIFLIISSKAEN